MHTIFSQTKFFSPHEEKINEKKCKEIANTQWQAIVRIPKERRNFPPNQHWSGSQITVFRFHAHRTEIHKKLTDNSYFNVNDKES